jgi:nitrate/nitrite transporter NarK
LFLTEAYGETVVWAGIITNIMHAVGSISSLFGGAIADKYDKSLIMISAYIGIAFTTILLAVGQFTSAILLFVMILYGVACYLLASFITEYEHDAIEKYSDSPKHLS